MSTRTPEHVMQWPEFADNNFIVPALFLVASLVLYLIISPLHAWAHGGSGCYGTLLKGFFGTPDEPKVDYPGFLVFLSIGQILLSGVDVWLWQHNVYQQRVDDRWLPLQQFSDGFFILYYFVQRIRTEFSVSSAMSFACIVDFVTVVPELVHIESGFLDPYDTVPPSGRWLTLRYLRAYRAVQSYWHICDIVDVPDISQLTRSLFAFFLNTCSLVVCMGGTVFVLEVLGPFKGWQDEYIKTNMGDLSAVHMFYWIFESISTVGYGDLSPTTVPSRCATIVFIFVGIIFFGAETEGLVSISIALSEGKGKYIKKNADDRHMVVVGNGLSKRTSFLEAFLAELVATASNSSLRNARAPVLLLLSEKKYDDEMLDFVKTFRKVKLFSGSAMVPQDLERVRLAESHMAFVIPEIACSDSRQEDGENILRAIHMRQHAKGLRLRMMLLLAESKLKAVTMGFLATRCFAAEAVKANIFANSARVKGFLPLMATCMQDVDTKDFPRILETMSEDEKQWMPNYLNGIRSAVRGFLAGQTLDGKTFTAATTFMYEQSGGKVLLVAVQSTGAMMVNSSEGNLKKGQVVMAISPSREDLYPFEDSSNEHSWEMVFSQDRVDYYSSEREMKVEQVGMNALSPHGQASFHEIVKGDDDSGEKKEEVRKVRNIGSMTEIGGSFDVRRSDVATGGLIVMYVIAEDTWHPVGTVLLSLRSEKMPFWQPIMCISATRPPPRLAKLYASKQVEFLVGPFQDIENLRQTSLEKASVVLVFRERVSEKATKKGENGLVDTEKGTNPILEDHSSVVLASMIEEYLQRCEGECFSMYEFNCTVSVNLVDHRSEQRHFPEATSQFRFLGKTPENSETMRALRDTFKPVHLWYKNSLNIIQSVWLGQRDGAIKPENKLIYQPFFASGKAFTADVFGAMLGRSFRFPATLEFAEAVTMSERHGQSSLAFQVRCPPEWVGKPFGELVTSWIQSKDPRLKQCGQVLPIAIYRTMELRNGPLLSKRSYMHVLPEKDEVLVATDLVTVFAPYEFAKVMAGDKLLNGSEAFVESVVAPASQTSRGTHAPDEPSEQLLNELEGVVAPTSEQVGSTTI